MPKPDHMQDNPALPDTFEAPEGHQFVVVGPHCWGRGKTIRVARNNAKRNLPSAQKGYRDWMVRMIPDEDWDISQIDGSLSFMCHDCGHHDCHGYKEYVRRGLDKSADAQES